MCIRDRFYPGEIPGCRVKALDVVHGAAEMRESPLPLVLTLMRHRAYRLQQYPVTDIGLLAGSPHGNRRTDVSLDCSPCRDRRQHGQCESRQRRNKLWLGTTSLAPGAGSSLFMPNEHQAKQQDICAANTRNSSCLLYTSPSPRDRTRYRMPSSA